MSTTLILRNLRRIRDKFPPYIKRVTQRLIGDEKFILVETTDRFKSDQGKKVNKPSCEKFILELCSQECTLYELKHAYSVEFGLGKPIQKELQSLIKQLISQGLLKKKNTNSLFDFYLLDYKPAIEAKSEKAQRLVDFCLGAFKNKKIPECSKESLYLKHQKLHYVRSNKYFVVLKSMDWKMNWGRDTKGVIKALIEQKARIPHNLSAWLLTGDYTGENTDNSQGLHLSSVRSEFQKQIVLMPSSNRDRYLGPNLEKQLQQIKKIWTPWQNKSNSVWWGGAFTGTRTQKSSGEVLSRKAVIEYFDKNPSDKVQIHLCTIPRMVATIKQMNLTHIEPKGTFEKEDAFKHKCVVLLKGQDIASASSWLFAGNSVVLMQPSYVDHILYFELEPWVHYVPLSSDPADILKKLDWVLSNEKEAQQIVANAHERLKWLSGPEYTWACNEVLRRICN